MGPKSNILHKSLHWSTKWNSYESHILGVGYRASFPGLKQLDHAFAWLSYSNPFHCKTQTETVTALVQYLVSHVGFHFSSKLRTKACKNSTCYQTESVLLLLLWKCYSNLRMYGVHVNMGKTPKYFMNGQKILPCHITCSHLHTVCATHLICIMQHMNSDLEVNVYMSVLHRIKKSIHFRKCIKKTLSITTHYVISYAKCTWYA